MINERYGIISKAVMTDPTVSITAKAIYAYLCSMANDKDIAYPHRDTILRELRIEAKTYYRHLRQLTQKEYVVILRDRSSIRQNEYFLPRRQRAGYGFVFQSVLRSSLSVKAKALYAYFACFAGSGSVAHPRRANILYHLNIAERTYYTHLAELRDGGIISSSNSRVNGKLRTTFTLPLSASAQISTMHASSSPRNDHVKNDHATLRKINRTLTNRHKRLNREEEQSAMIIRAMIRAALATCSSWTPSDKLTRKRLNNLLEACNSIFTYPTTKLKGITYDRQDIIKRATLHLHNGALCVADMIDIAEQSLNYVPVNETAYMSALFLSRLYPRA